MLPAHQRLEAGDAAVGKMGDGLVDDEQLPVLHGQAQFALEAGTPPGPLFHQRLEDAIASATHALGLAHREAGVLQHAIGIGGVAGAQSHTDAGRAVHRHPVDQIRLAQRVDQALRHQGSDIGAVHRLEHDGEFIHAEPAGSLVTLTVQDHPVALAHRRIDTRSHHAQQLVAGRRAQRHVDTVEPVAVDEQHREVMVRIDAGPLQRVLDAFQQDDAVGHRRQAVDAAGVAQLGLDVLPLQPQRRRDVGHAAHQHVDVQAQQADRQGGRYLVARRRRPHAHAQAIADVAARIGCSGSLIAQLRRSRPQHVEQVAQFAVHRQRHQQLCRHRVDHRDLTVQRHLHQPDRGLVEELHQRLVRRRARFAHIAPIHRASCDCGFSSTWPPLPAAVRAASVQRGCAQRLWHGTSRGRPAR